MLVLGIDSATAQVGCAIGGHEGVLASAHSSRAKRHAEIRVSMAGFTLSDEGGGVRVNGVPVNQHLLRHEDVVEFGPARFAFREG